MSKIDQIKELRTLTLASMKDCASALEEAAGDLQKAVDLIKAKGQAVVSNGRVASEGIICIRKTDDIAAMVEVNCNTDFVARSQEFKEFAANTALDFIRSITEDTKFEIDEAMQKHLMYTTKENVSVRRWTAQQLFTNNAKLFTYIHTNNKIGVILTLSGNIDDPDFNQFGEDLTLQIAAMNPLVVSPEDLSEDVKLRQRAIFIKQMEGSGKTGEVLDKIIDGRVARWYGEVCLLGQMSIIVAKTQIRQLLKNVETTSGMPTTIANFLRFEVGDGIEVQRESLVDEVSKLLEQK
jgi:elongation factor Ts